MSETNLGDGETYDRDLGVFLGACTVWSDGRVDLDSETIDRYDLTGDMIDLTVEWGSSTVPLTDATVTKRGLVRIPKAVRENYGVPCGNGASVNVRIHGVNRRD